MSPEETELLEGVRISAPRIDDVDMIGGGPGPCGNGCFFALRVDDQKGRMQVSQQARN